MPVYDLGNGNDYFNSAFKVDWTNDSSVFGSNGDDAITARALSPTYTSRLFIDGGNGNDTVLLDASNSVALGGNGDDTLTSTGGLGNTLVGGNGDDLLISVGGGSGMGPGNTLTGGLGRDSFRLVNDGNLVVTEDAGANGVVSDGDVFVGPMDVITDYQRGEHIGLRNYDVSANGPAAADTPVARVDSVALAPDPLAHAGDSFRPVIGSQQYAVFHGTFAGVNSFTVNSSGPDLFVVYDTRTGPNELVGKGSLVLLGQSDTQLVAQALSSATTGGAGGDWAFFGQAGGSGGASFDIGGEDQATTSVPASLDPAVASLSATSLIPT